MMPPEVDSPQRSATRAAIEASVRLQFDDSLDVVDGRCYNISIGGMFLESDVIRPQGSLVRFELLLEEGVAVRGLGEVVWAQATAIPGRRAGLGLKFRFLEQRDRQAIFKLVSQHIKEKLAQRPPMAGEPPVPDNPLARQRRASLLGEGVVEPAPALVPPPPPGAPAVPPTPAPPVERPSRVVPIISAGAPIPAPRPPEPARGGDRKTERPLEERTWQQPVVVPPSARPSRPADPSWLDDEAGFAPEAAGPRASLPLKPDAREDWDDRPLGPAPATPQHYLEETDPTHFEHRPRPRSFPLGLVLAVAGALLALALIYFFFFRPSSGPPQVLHIGTGAAGVPAPAPTEPPPPPERATPAPAPAEISPPAPTRPETPAAEPSAPVPAAAPPARAEERKPEAKPAPPAAKEFERVKGVEVRKAGGGLEIVIETDGEIPASRYSSARLEGRELIKLYGVKDRYGKKELAVGDRWVKGLRFGYHAGGARGNEVHVVIDLASPSAKVARITSEGRRLVVLVATD